MSFEATRPTLGRQHRDAKAFSEPSRWLTARVPYRRDSIYSNTVYYIIFALTAIRCRPQRLFDSAPTRCVRVVCGERLAPLTVRSSHHAAVSLLVSVAAVWFLRPAAPIALVAAGTVAGVAIDLDHFPIARLRSGDWRSARRVLANPLLVVTDPERIFEGVPLNALERLLTHVLLGGLAVSVAWLAWPALGVVLGVSLYVHIAADLGHDVWLLHRSTGDSAGRPR